jgi:hypothetical protein
MQCASGPVRHVLPSLFVLLCLRLESSAKSDDAAGLFGFDKIHSAHLVFADDQWAAIKPTEPARGPGGPGGPGGRAGADAT